MTNHSHIEKALEKKARRRKYKNRPKMGISGRQVFDLQKQKRKKR